MRHKSCDQTSQSRARTWRCFIKDRSGATAIEYAMIVALIGLVVTAAIRTFDVAIYNLMSAVVGKF